MTVDSSKRKDAKGKTKDDKHKLHQREALGDDLTRDRSIKFRNRRHVPLPTGPYKVIGCKDILVGFGRKSGVMLRLWYPARQATKTSNISNGAASTVNGASKGVQEHYLMWPNWLPHENYKWAYAAHAGVKWPPLLKFYNWLNEESFIPCLPDEKPLKRPQGYPVIVFSHGVGACRTTYSGICLELASHGFVVASIEHRDNSACAAFYAKEMRMKTLYGTYLDGSNYDDTDDAGHLLRNGSQGASTNDSASQDENDDEVDAFGGDTVDDPNYVPVRALEPTSSQAQVTMQWIPYRKLKKSGKEQYEIRNKQIHQRVRETIRALDVLEALNAGYDQMKNILDPRFDVSEWEGLLDMDNIILAGHSFGAATTIMTLATELRFRAGICLDAWMWPIRKESATFELVQQPLMFINTEAFQTTKNVEKITELLKYSAMIPDSRPGHRRCATIKGSVHFNQTDLPFVLHPIIKRFAGAVSKIDPFTAHDLTCALMLQFIKDQLNIPLSDQIDEVISRHQSLLKFVDQIDGKHQQQRIPTLAKEAAAAAAGASGSPTIDAADELDEAPASVPTSTSTKLESEV